jgi:hypothetical protein
MFDYIRLTPGFVREVLDAYESWNGREGMPLKLQELMMVLQIEVSHRDK